MEDNSARGLGVGWRVPLLRALPQGSRRLSEYSSFHPSASSASSLLQLCQKLCI